MNNYRFLQTDINDSIAVLSIHRPDKLNALNSELLSELKDFFTSVNHTSGIAGIIITGTGEKSFVAGADIREISELDREGAYQFALRGQEIFNMISHSGKPVIAAVNGFALGGGCELALSCHLIMAAQNARFGFPEVSLGLIPGFGGTQRLASLVGRANALEMILTGEMIDAERALKIGLVNHVFPEKNEMISNTRQLLNKIIKNAPVAISLAIQSVNQSNLNPEGFKFEARSFSEAASTNDFKEGTRAFLDKKIPVFKGN